MKEACIRAELTRAHWICNNTRTTNAAETTIQKKLLKNGYSMQAINEQKRKAKQITENKQRNGNKVTPDKPFYIKFPFISDNFSFKLARVFKQQNL